MFEVPIPNFSMNQPALPGSLEKKQESRDAQKVLKRFESRLKPLGFKRTKPSFFVRPGKHILEFVHVHKFSFAPSLRVHFGARVRSDDFSGSHLNGPCSDGIAEPGNPDRRRDDFDYTTSEESWEQCAEAMLQCVLEEGSRWFAALEDHGVLLSASSPLSAAAVDALRTELEQPCSARVSDATHRVLGLGKDD